jgi:hypothetical protein
MLTRRGRAGVAGAAPPLRDPVCEIHVSSRFKSRIDCQRSSASRAKHVLITWSSADGTIGCNTVIAGGSSLRIAPITLAALAPSKARRPVTIS